MDATDKKDNATNGKPTSGETPEGPKFGNCAGLAEATDDPQKLKSNLELLLATAEAEVASLSRMIDMVESHLDQSKNS